MLQAFVLVQAEPGTAARVAAALARLDGVLSAALVTGPYDVIVRAEATSVDELGKLVLRPIQHIEGVIRTMTCPILHRD
ncbi:MAG TPA: Lrp/AsnC ligand binding domain-containing protein [Actinomycetota bacterium]|jgi:DNA-binding Lrp family transcriptional regulator|nr:Lrp/AsnC ligand binding domain-containing protein [Actinomycetota bacterium]